MNLFDEIDITDQGQKDIDLIRMKFFELNHFLYDKCSIFDLKPFIINGRELEICKQKLEEACMYAIKSCCIKNKI